MRNPPSELKQKNKKEAVVDLKTASFVYSGSEQYPNRF
jgi:hypothetical protein